MARNIDWISIDGAYSVSEAAIRLKTKKQLATRPNRDKARYIKIIVETNKEQK